MPDKRDPTPVAVGRPRVNARRPRPQIAPRRVVASRFETTVCFLVSCNRHWFNRVPGSILGIDCLPSALTLTLAIIAIP